MSDVTDRLRQRLSSKEALGQGFVAVEVDEFTAMLDVIDATDQAVSWTRRSGNGTPVMTKPIVERTEAALARFREVAGE